MVQKEKVRVNNTSIENLINKNFLESIEKEVGQDIIPISIVFIKKPATPIIISHENQKEIEDKILHINCLDESILDKLAKLLEKKE